MLGSSDVSALQILDDFVGIYIMSVVVSTLLLRHCTGIVSATTADQTALSSNGK